MKTICVSENECRKIDHTPTHIERKWLRNAPVLDRLRKRGFDIFYHSLTEAYVERIDEAESWAKDYGYPIPQLNSDKEAIVLARQLGLPVLDSGLITDFIDEREFTL